MMFRLQCRENAPGARHPWKMRAPASYLALGLLLSGCGGGATDALPRKAVSGAVTLDGQPLAKGSISFDPENVPTDPVSVGSIIEDGYYSIDSDGGPTPGTYRVSIRAGGSDEAEANLEAPGLPPKKAAPEPIPAMYNTRTTLKAEVTADGSNTFDFTLTSK